MEKEENQNSTSADKNLDSVKETEKPKENLEKENSNVAPYTSEREDDEQELIRDPSRSMSSSRSVIRKSPSFFDSFHQDNGEKIKDSNGIALVKHTEELSTKYQCHSSNCFDSTD